MPSKTHASRATAVVLAGGTGRRIGLDIPKQLLKIAGKTILEHTLAVFDAAEEIEDVIVLMAPGWAQDAQRIVDSAGFGKVTLVMEGGSTRNDTSVAAIETLSSRYPADGEDRKVLFHDAVRPLLDPRIITECVAALDRYQAVDVAIASADTIIVTRTHGEDGEFITDVPDRSRLRRGQTPQAFRLSTIRRAYELASRDPNFQATDDCSVVLNYLPDVPIHVVEGDDTNMKVTRPLDVFLADKLFQLASQTAPVLTEEGYRERLEGRTVVIFGGSYGIGADIAEIARSYGAKVFPHSRTSTGVHVEEPDHVTKALTAAHEATGRIDFVVNTAGVLRTGKLVETDTTTIDEMLRINYLAPVHLARLAHPYLAATKGQLLLYTSSSYTRGRADYSLYSSAKAATVNLTQALADEWAADGIRVNCVNPERTRTPMREAAFGAEDPQTLLSSEMVARTSVDVLISRLTGQVVDVRRSDPTRVPAARERVGE